MITSITIKDVASYDSVNGEKIEGLKSVNFFFGFNGTGKSTIAKYIQSLNLKNKELNPDFDQCSNIGFDNEKFEILTFNEEFTNQNFIRNSDLKGVFSLNKSNKEIDKKITSEESRVNEFDNQIDKYEELIETIEENESDKTNDLLEHCWNQRKTFETFSKISLLHSGSKPNNLQYIRSLLPNNLGQISTLEDLTDNYKNLYESNLREIPVNLNVRNYMGIRRLEIKIQSLLSEVIVGNEDVDIADLINSLDMKNWIELGLPYLEKSGSTCPFCQQDTIDESLTKQFETLFDDTYKNKIAHIKRLKDQYSEKTKTLITEISSIQDYYNPKNKVSNLILSLKSHFEENIDLINDKIEAANEKRSINSLIEFKSDLSSTIDGIKSNNQLFQDVDSSKEILIKEIWKFIADNCKDEIAIFDSRESKYERIKKLADGLKSRTLIKKKNSIANIESLRSQTVNTKEAVNNINTILKNSGFDGFEIDEKDKNNNISRYYLKRSNSCNPNYVFNTLSEGEKNFISFLYFFQLCLGTDDLQKTGDKQKIIVIDDPVSSLDSQALFIVSTLIHKLLECKSANSKSERKQLKNLNISQIFILTHNLYFYKEVSFKRRPICTDYWHYRVTKVDNTTKIEGDYNRKIKDDYTLMWDNLKDVKSNLPSDSSQNILISNTMRRIIESYVSFIGFGHNSWASIEVADSTDSSNYIKSAFISTINDDSHGVSVMDSVYYQKIINENPVLLFDVFSSIFKKIGKEHYEMMMNEELD